MAAARPWRRAGRASAIRRHGCSGRARGAESTPAANALTTHGERFDPSSNDCRSVLPPVATRSGPSRREADGQLQHAFGIKDLDRLERASPPGAPCADFVKRRRSASFERPKGAMSVRVRSPQTMQGSATVGLMKVATGRVAGARILRPFEDSLEALHCPASCRDFQTASNAPHAKVKGNFKRDCLALGAGPRRRREIVGVRPESCPRDEGPGRRHSDNARRPSGSHCGLSNEPRGVQDDVSWSRRRQLVSPSDSSGHLARTGKCMAGT